MDFLLSRTAVLLSSVLFSGVIAAQNPDLIRDKVYSAVQSKVASNHLSKSHYDPNLSANVFNWNNGSINKISLHNSATLKKQYTAALDTYFEQTAQLHGANKTAVSQASLKSIHDTGHGGLIAKYNQKVDGIDVFSRSISVLINRKNEYVASSGYFSSSTKSPKVGYVLSETDALEIGFKKATGEEIYLNSVINANNSAEYKQLTSATFSTRFRMAKSSRAKKVFYPIAVDKLIPAYYVEIKISQVDILQSKLISYVVDGVTGKILFKNNMTSHASTTYNVFADSSNGIPYDGPQGNSLTPHPTGDRVDTPNIGGTFVEPNLVTMDFGPISTSDPWLTNTETSTRGNNVDAYADISGEDGFDLDDIRPEMTTANAFEYDFATFSDGLTGDPQKFAVVNLFYINNYLHDWFYDNGFDEAAGNAQQNNFGRGGADSDRLMVEAQDFADTNNANMSTPSDGSSPTMQMFVWTFLSDSSVDISGITIANSTSAVFGPGDFDITGVMSLVDDGTDPNGDGCETITTDLTGLIAVIDRGFCNFTVKVKNAQDKGAIGVLMLNINAGEAPITMGGEDATVTIPSMMVSLEKGDEIKAALAANSSLETRLFNQAQPLDGTLDNGIVAHEWAHYLSNRLVGNSNGLVNNQGRSMGEGWSDFVALLMVIKEPDNLIVGNENYQGLYSATTFVGDAYNGIRRAPFTTDMTKNAFTFKHIEDGVALPLTHHVAYGQSGSNNSEVHNAGEIWALMLWDSFISLVNKPGYSFEQAREVMKDYLVAGMKMTPNSPTMVEARDALLSAALASNVDDFKIIRGAFARRGMGAGAMAPDRNSDSHKGVVEDFSPGVDVQAIISVDTTSFDVGSCDSDGVLDASESATINMTFKNYSSGALPSFNVDLSSTSDVSFANSVVAVDALAAFGDSVSKSFDITLNSSSHMEEITISAAVSQIGNLVDDYIEPAPITAVITTHFDFLTNTSSDDMSSAAASEFDWSAEVNSAQLTSFIVEDAAWYGVDNGAPGTSDLITPEIKVAAAGDFILTFDHFYYFESSEDVDNVLQNWDGGVIELSVDGGIWVDVVDYGASLSDPYNGTLSSFSGVLANRSAYTATRDPDNLALFTNTLTFPDGLVNGHDVRIRFRIGTDANTSDFGWLIDNVVVTNATTPMFSEVVTEDNICLSGNVPEVNAGGDISSQVSGTSDVTINLSGTATDADGDMLTVLWTQRSGPAVTINNSNTLDANFMLTMPTVDSDMVFELTATGGGHTISDTVMVAIRINVAPTVTATGSTVTENSMATLTATANDDNGDTLSYSWTQTTGPTVTLSGADSANASFTAPMVDTTTTLTFEVVVSDAFVSSAPASATVTVNNQAPPPTTGGGGGGGSIPLSLLLMLGSLLGVNRLFRKSK